MEIQSLIKYIVPALWRCGKEHAFYCIDLEDDLNELRAKRNELSNLYWKVKHRPARPEQKQLQQTDRVNDWLQDAEARVKVANDLLKKGEQEVCKKGLRTFSRSMLGKNVKELLIDQFEKWSDEDGHLQSLTTVDRAERPVGSIPKHKDMENEPLFKDVLWGLKDEKVGVIGIHGRGGVGKTTVLTKVYDHLSQVTGSDRTYDLIIFVGVGKENDLGKIQREVWKKLSIPDSDGEWESMDPYERVTRTLSLLKGKRFLLFLDDIWGVINIHEDIGIPKPVNGKFESKVIFATRSSKVCEQMGAHMTKMVQTLPLSNATQLFEELVGEETLKAVGNTGEFLDIVKECEGLPLAIKISGKTMAMKRNLNEWRLTISELKKYLFKFPFPLPTGCEYRVFKSLMFYYKCLPDATHHQCFLFCALYPEDYKISRVDLVELWVAKGLFGSVDVHSARNRGRYILGNLVQVGMLEVDTNGHIKMHDFVRDMALWIVRDHNTSKNKVIVQQPFDPKEWEAAEKISIWESKVVSTLAVQSSWTCPSLNTLILRSACIRFIPYGFFSAMPKLTTLDLHGNSQLGTIPDDVGELVHLQSLDLSLTNICFLPIKMQNLTKLKFLLLSHVYARSLRNLVSKFIHLRLFAWQQEDKDVDVENGVATIEALQLLKHLNDVSLSLSNSEQVEKLLSCPGLLECVSSLVIRESVKFWSSYVRSLSESSSSSSTMTMMYLRSLTLRSSKREAFQLRFLPQHPSCSLNRARLKDEAYFPNLREVRILGCEALIDLTLLIYNAPCLEWLVVESCSSLQEVIVGEIEEDVGKLFACLTYLELKYLPHLNNICRRTLLFPSIRDMRVLRCPKLRKLPLSDKVVNNNFKITIEEMAQFNTLQWDDQHLKWALEESCLRILPPVLWPTPPPLV